MRPKIPYSLNGGAQAAGPNLRHGLEAVSVGSGSPPPLLPGYNLPQPDAGDIQAWVLIHVFGAFRCAFMG
jgi:hypothetical protein